MKHLYELNDKELLTKYEELADEVLDRIKRLEPSDKISYSTFKLMFQIKRGAMIGKQAKKELHQMGYKSISILKYWGIISKAVGIGNLTLISQFSDPQQELFAKMILVNLEGKFTNSEKIMSVAYLVDSMGKKTVRQHLENLNKFH